MTWKMFSPIPARIVQVLRDRLTAELVSIDADLADGITTPAVPTGNFHEHLRAVVTSFPAIRLEPQTVQLPGDVNPRPFSFGDRLDASYLVNVWVDVSLATADDDALRMQRLVMRYVNGIAGVLLDRFEGLETIADPTRFANSTTKGGDITIGPEVDQEGITTRSGIVPIKVRRIEAR